MIKALSHRYSLYLSCLLAGGGYSLDIGILQCLCAIPILFILPLRSYQNENLTTFLFAGALLYTSVFFWIPYTIIGYFNTRAIFALFYSLLFIFITALQFPITVAIFRNIPGKFIPDYVRFPLAWMSTEYTYPRLTGGSISNLLNYSTVSHTVSLVGEYGLTFICLLITCGLIFKKYYTSVVLLMVLLFGGYYVENSIKQKMASTKFLDVLVVQTNFPPEHKNIDPLGRLNTLQSLTGKAVTSATTEIDLIIWAESSVLLDTPDTIKEFGAGHPADPFPGLHIPLLYGTQSRNSLNKYAHEYYNSAILKLPGGKVAGTYFKKNLFPFTEYNPLSTALWSKNYTLLPGAPKQEMIALDEYYIGCMICYDDLWSGDFSHYGKDERPKILISLLNDAWFCSEIAQKQHSLLSSMRAKELNSSLIRATNSGLSIAYDPLGKEITRLPAFQRETAIVSVPALGTKSFFAVCGDGIFFLISCLVVLLSCTKIIILKYLK